MSQLTHFDDSGAARMVDVGSKPVSARMARASGSVTMEPATLMLIRDGGSKKGDVLEVARLAGIMAAKRLPHGCWAHSQMAFSAGSIALQSYWQGRPGRGRGGLGSEPRKRMADLR